MYKKRKKITVKEYIKKVQESQYIPENLLHNEESQRLLEGTRNIIKEEEKGNLRLFANNVTKHWVYPPEGLRLINYVDNRYFSRVILYFLFTNIVESLIVNRRRSTVDLHLRSFLTEILDNYFSNKKIKSKVYNSLTEIEKSKIFDQFIANFWSNLIKLDLVERTKGSIISLKKETSFMLFDALISVKFRNYPCIYKPKPWDLSGVNGGYYTVNTSLITAKPTFFGTVSWTNKLISLINELQSITWTIDFPLEYIETDFTFNEDKVLFDNQPKFPKKKTTNDKEDIVQQLHTRFFLEKFASKNKNFYYPYYLDFRGRVYPLCSWGYSPTSSKKVRQCLRTTQEYKLTDIGKFWLKVYLASILQLEQETYNTTVELIDNKWDTVPDLLNKMSNNYTKHLATTVYKDIIRGYSSLLIQFDATSSVYQIIGIIINDKKLMQNTNLLDDFSQVSSVNKDFVYKDIYSYIENICRENIPNDVYNIFLERTVFKNVLMPLIYGKTMNKNVADLAKYIKSIGNLYLTGTLKENKELYDQYKALQDYPIKKVLQDLPQELRDNFKDILNSGISEVEIFYWKTRYMSHVFFRVMSTSLYTEFPNLKNFTGLFTGKTPQLKHSTYETPYFSFENKHKKKKKYNIDVTMNKQRNVYWFPEIINELEKKTTGEAANCVHSLDAFIMHYILEHRKGIPLIPIHDCVMIHPNDTDFVFTLITKAYTELQKQISSNVVFSQFHKEGSIPLTSYNIFKFEYKEIKQIQDDVIKNDLFEEDNFFEEQE